MLNRDNEEYAKTVFEKLYPDETERRLCANLLADSIEYAAGLSKSNWGVTLYPNLIRLNVGRPYVLDLKRGKVNMVIDTENLGPEEVIALDQICDSYQEFTFLSVSGKQIEGSISVSRLASALEFLREPYYLHISKGSGTMGKYSHAGSHSPGIIKYLCSFLDREIPQPEYDGGAIANEPEYEEIEIEPHPESPFTHKTFDLLGDLHENPTRDFYESYKSDFEECVISPLKILFSKVFDKLHAQIKHLMETESGIFSKIPKHDYGRGGAWDYYWGAFYTRGGKRSRDAQLFIWLNREIFDFGFRIGAYQRKTDQRKRFLKNCRERPERITHILQRQLDDETLLFGGGDSRDENFLERSDFVSGNEWLKDPEKSSIHVKSVLKRDELLRMSESDLVERIANTFERLFPLVLLAILDDPFPAIGEYLGEVEEEIELNPEYALDDFAEETSFEKAELERWVRAVERKGQAIAYGPPGTGKTFLAERLARHLIGGGDGFCELVQFHPSYAYEDFIQGIRPKGRGEGGLDYPMLPGRFKEFCQRAISRKGLCVLVIDEINRANLSQVFGELMYLLEYRDRDVPLAGGVERFNVPKNVRIIGTMNTADRSIALVDHALRRRFAFVRLDPRFDILRRFHEKKDTGFDVEPLIKKIDEINRDIGDPNYSIGITFFLDENLSENIEDIWRMEIEPYLEEYFFDREEITKKYRWDKFQINGSSQSEG